MVFFLLLLSDMEVSTSGITQSHSEKCQPFLEEAPAGTHITVKKLDVFLLFILYFDLENNIKLSFKNNNKINKYLKCYST